jgi:hypothetical protein
MGEWISVCAQLVPRIHRLNFGCEAKPFIDFKNRTAVIPVMQDRDPSAALDVGLAYPKVP